MPFTFDIAGEEGEVKFDVHFCPDLQGVVGDHEGAAGTDILGLQGGGHTQNRISISPYGDNGRDTQIESLHLPFAYLGHSHTFPLAFAWGTRREVVLVSVLIKTRWYRNVIAY